jgi:hypothetical protein
MAWREFRASRRGNRLRGTRLLDPDQRRRGGPSGGPQFVDLSGLTCGPGTIVVRPATAGIA